MSFAHLRFQFQRHECKYLLTETRAAALRRAVAPWVVPDPFGEPSGGRYRIGSLYLDTPTFLLHRQTREGQRNRVKLRIRAYSDDPREAVFFEIKRRRNAIISKSRVRVPRSVVARVFQGGRSARVDGAQQECFDEFVGWMEHLGARPVVNVRYLREAYVGAFDPTQRVTFDRQIMASASERPEVLLERGERWVTVEGRLVVLELKFTGRCPRWMDDVIHRFELKRTSYSKYSHGLQAAAGDVLGRAS